MEVAVMRAIVSLMFMVLLQTARADDAACLITTSDDPLFGTSIPGWYGTEALAVTLSTPANLVYEPHGWLMLTGVDFPDPGCWEITASYLGQTLKFVAQTVKGKGP
jgi:hypothetical protein